jgi:hypothetical protein
VASSYVKAEIGRMVVLGQFRQKQVHETPSQWKKS